MNEEIRINAETDYMNGMKYKDIAAKYGVTINTVKSWKTRYKWSKDKKKGVHTKSKKVRTQKGGQPGNTNAVGHGGTGPPGNKNIQIAYAAIMRAQRIAYVKDQHDKTIEKIERKDGNVIGERWEVQQAWDKQNEFLKAQARAQSELRLLIRQYDEMLHENWELSTEEQKARVEQLKARTEQIQGAEQNQTEDKVRKLFEAIGGALDESE